MRFTTFILSTALAAVASAQDPTTTSSSTSLETASATGSLTPAQSSAIACIDACDDGDVSCQSKCIAVPDPSASQANATNQCVAGCNQGNGSAADTQAYGDCVQNCIGQNFFTTSGTPSETTGSSSGSDSSATATGTGSSTSGSSATGSSTGTATGSSASASSTDNAAVRLGVTSTALMGLLAVAFAL